MDKQPNKQSEDQPICRQAPKRTKLDEQLSRIALRITGPVRQYGDAGIITNPQVLAMQEMILAIAKKELAAVHFGCSDLDKNLDNQGHLYT